MTAHLLTCTTIVAVFVMTLWHGHQSLQRELRKDFSAIIIQGNIDTSFDGTGMTEEQSQRHYEELTLSALQKAKQNGRLGDMPMVIWPESMRYPYRTFSDSEDPRIKQFGIPSNAECQGYIASYVQSFSKRHNIEMIDDVSFLFD